MTYQGIDTAAKITAAQAKKLRENGVSFVGRYITPGKSLDAAEITALRENGLAIMLCWESTATRMKGGAKAGAEDAERAAWYAQNLGVPPGTVIYFAADYDVPASDFLTIEAYLKTAKYNIGEYGVGLYGPENVVAEMSRTGACYYFWQCVAWSNQRLPAADVFQYAWQGDARAKEMAAKCGILAVDLDSAETLAGMWMPPVEEQPAHWYDEAMAWAEENGLMMDGRPNDTVTRAELATVLMRFDAKVKETIFLHLPEDDSFGGLLN